MADVGNLKTRISLDSAQFEQSMAGVNRQLKGLKQEQKAVTSTGTGFARGVDELRGKSDVLTRTLKVQDAQVVELRRRYEESRKATGDNSKETQNANAAYQRAKAEMNKTENALKGITAEIEKQTNPWNKLSEGMDNAGRKMQDYGKGMTDFGKGMTTKVTLPILGIGAGILKVGMEFEQGMSQVQALTQGTGEEMVKMSDQAKHLGETTRFSATQAAEGMAFLGMAGWDTNSILEGMPGLLSLAASANMELGRAADITSNIMAAFNIEAAEAGRVSDILAHAASNSNTNVEQLGEAMKYVAPTANTLGLSIEDTAAAIMAVSDAGIQGGQAGRAFGTSLLRLADPTKAMKDEMKKLKLSFFDAEGAMKPLPDIIEQLEKGMTGYSDEQRAASLSTLFGTEAQRHWAIMLDTGSEALGKNSKELEKSEGAAQRMADTMSDNAKGKIVEFKSALEGIGIALSEHMIPAVTDAVEWGTELVRKFGELDDETQENIIKMGLFAAAIGPAALVLGSMTTAIGGVVKFGGSLVGLLGGSGGLIARIGLMGVATGPVGLAVGTIGLLGGAIYLLTRDSMKLHDVNWELVESMKAEVDATDDLIEQYESLESQNRLTKDEMLRYMDILSELKQVDGAEAIKALTDEQAELLEKSGFTNDEMETFLGLNDKIIEKTPEIEKAISDQGNAYVTNLNILKELNEEKRKELLITAERELLKALENETILLERQKELVEEIKQTDIDIAKNREDRIANTKLIKEEEEKLELIDQRILALKEEMKDLDHEALMNAEGELRNLEHQYLEQLNIVKAVDDEQDILESTYQTLTDKLIKKGEDLDATREEIRQVEQLKGEYESLILAQVDITAEKGNGLKAIDEEIKKVEETKKKLEEQTDPILKNTEGYKEHVSQLNTQLGKLKDAQTELKNINELAGKTVYDKNIHIKTSPSIQSLNDMLSAPINKRIQAQGYGFRALAYATGTDNHPGGPFIAGEEGWELGRLGNQWEMLNFGMYDRPRGYEVFTHDESKKILGALNNVPAYASGVSSSGEANRVVGQLNNQQQVQEYRQVETKQPAIVNVYVGSKRIVRELIPDINRLQGDMTKDYEIYG